MPDADHAHPTVLVKTAPSIRDAPAPSNHQSAGILTCDGFAQNSRNPTHGSGWIGSGRFYRHLLEPIVIPPTAVGGYFKSFSERNLNNPPTTVGGIRERPFVFRLEKHLNDPPTAVGGIPGFLCKAAP